MANVIDEVPLPRPRSAVQGGSRKTRARALLFMVMALALGVGAAGMINRYIGLRTLALARGEVVQVAVAAIDIPLGTTLREEMVAYVDWPAQALPKGAFKKGEPLVGRVTAKDFAAGEPFVGSRVATEASGVGMAAVVPSELRAMTVQVNEVIGVSGFIHPNDMVDVITTMRTELTPGGRQDFRSKIVLQDVRVLAVGQQMETRNDKPVKVPVVTLLVTPEDSERLALASTQGKIQLTLRSRSDAEQVETDGVTPPELFGSDPGTPPPPALASAPVPKRQRAAGRHEPAPAPKKADVVEVLRGDRFEERKLRSPEDAK